MKIIATTILDPPKRLRIGDTFHLDFVLCGKRTRVLSHEIDAPMTVDIAHVVEFEDGDLGLTCGIGGVFGQTHHQAAKPSGVDQPRSDFT